MARPRKQVDEKLLHRLASIHCTMEEIAYMSEVSVDTLERRFADVIKKGHSEGKMSVRRKQMILALGTDAQPAEYLRNNGGDFVLNKEGQPILIKSEQKAVAPSVAMLIWLGKQWLGQRETPVEVPTGKDSERAVYEIQWGGAEEAGTEKT